MEKQFASIHIGLLIPNLKIPKWGSLDPRQQAALLNSKWPSDIGRQRELDILRGLLGGN